MAEFFKLFGIALCVLIADGLFFGLLAVIKIWDITEDDAFLMPAIINGLLFVICATLLISQWIS